MKENFYKVKAGDSIWKICNENNYPIDEFLFLNNLSEESIIKENENLIIDPQWSENFGVLCNICGWEGNEFHAFDSGEGRQTEKTMCPECFSQPRHRSNYILLEETFPTDRPIKVLHFAPELCMASYFLSLENVEYLSVDLDPERAMQKEDITNLSFPDNSFDFIYCSHILEHVPDENKAMKELYRVLKPGGFSIIDVPIDYNREITYEDSTIVSPQDRAKEYWQWDHVRLYGKDFGKKLENVGFSIEYNQSIKELGWKPIKFMLLSDEIIYIASK